MRREDAARWADQGRRAVLVTVVEARGSVPREAGTRMLVAADAVLGSIGGGHLEWLAIDEARARLSRGAGDVHERRVALGPSLGQCCGGALTLRYEAFDAGVMDAWPASVPRLHLQLHGAGHVGRAIAQVLDTLPDLRVQWVDEREGEFPAAASASHVERVCAEPAWGEVRAAPPGACYLVLTHSHELDLRITEAVLRRGDFAYCGLIGSRTKRARFEHRLAERGVAPAALARLTCPIGVPGVSGKAPEVIAVAVVAQLLQQPSPAG